MKERITSKLLKIVMTLCVLVAVLAGANFLESITGVEKEFWWETICLIHISINISNRILGHKE